MDWRFEPPGGCTLEEAFREYTDPLLHRALQDAIERGGKGEAVTRVNSPQAKARQDLAVHCPRCNRWHQVDLAGMVKRGQGEREYIGLVFRCKDCGQIGQMQLQTPDVDQISHYVSERRQELGSG